MITRSVFGALICAIAFTTAIASSRANEHQDIHEGVLAFLRSDPELRKSFSCRFTGEFQQLPPHLEADLKQAFPMYRFYVAKMEVYLHLPSREYNLIVLEDAKNEGVAAYIWSSYWTLPPSASFERILQGHQAKSKEEALNQVRVLAQLIAYLNNDGIGKVTNNGGKLKVELLRGDEVFRILELKINGKLQLGRLSITDVDGRKPRYFV